MELLPEGCIANAISFTTPRDACRLSSVSTIFKSAAESDAVWESFLPPDYSTLLSSSSSSSSLRSSSKKELYFSLCHNPIFIDEGKKDGQRAVPCRPRPIKGSPRVLVLVPCRAHYSFRAVPTRAVPWAVPPACLKSKPGTAHVRAVPCRVLYRDVLVPCRAVRTRAVPRAVRPIGHLYIQQSFSLDKQSGKKCYMISARDLLIIWSSTSAYWRWISIPEARFPEVAELIRVCWLEIRGKISTRSLSPGTLYTAYLVYKLTAGSYGFEYQPVSVSVGLVNGETQTQTVYLHEERGLRQGYHGLLNRSSSQASTPKENVCYFPKERKDEWLEIELGDFFNEEDEHGELEMSVLELKGHWKRGLVIQGIDIRPKLGK
ncbi:F-box protein [Citrus sinensis]|uniref:F-box protein n=1 Tax=Citrus sinensis TaxID=2711 RepID=A0ACB8JP97_CITSI|nr:F-box protein [Citrus sinensis]